MKLFQLVITDRIVTVISAGRVSGSRTRQKNPNDVQPSIAAASSSSAGTARMNGRRMITVIGIPNAASGSATPSSVSSRWSWRSSR